MESCILHMEKDNFEKISKLFKTAYYIAQAERPFSDLCRFCNLTETMSVEFGLTYCSDKQAITMKDKRDAKLWHTSFINWRLDFTLDAKISKTGYPMGIPLQKLILDPA